jgi:hypothetical protein
MTAVHDLDRTLAAWLGTEAEPAPPPEPLIRILEKTRGRRSRPSFVAGFGSHWVSDSAGAVRDGTASLRVAVVIALVALLVVALLGGMLLIGGRRLVPPALPLRHTYLRELVSAPDLPVPMSSPMLVTLADGRVLVIGSDFKVGHDIVALVYDPTTGASVIAGPMGSPRSSIRRRCTSRRSVRGSPRGPADRRRFCSTGVS